MLNIFLVSALITFAVAIIAIGIYTYYMVKPLRQIAFAAHKFGQGDFSTRVKVKSRDEIGQLADEFNNMAESLCSSENIRRSFIANVSHELKTPMTTIAGFIDGILDGTIPPEKQNYYLKIVSDEVRRLSRLVRSMLDLSKIDNGELKLNYQNFDFVSTLISALVTFEAEIERKNIEIRGLEDMQSVYIDGDADLIHQVVYNLIENAVKFVNENGYIQFIINDLPDKTEFAIINSGHGIDKNDLGLVFDKFYKTDKSRSIDKKGMGLGLYLVKTIIGLHGGKITVSSEINKYCRFDFYIPRKTPKKSRHENKVSKLENKNAKLPFKKEIQKMSDERREDDFNQNSWQYKQPGSEPSTPQEEQKLPQDNNHNDIKEGFSSPQTHYNVDNEYSGPSENTNTAKQYRQQYQPNNSYFYQAENPHSTESYPKQQNTFSNQPNLSYNQQYQPPYSTPYTPPLPMSNGRYRTRKGLKVLAITLAVVIPSTAIGVTIASIK